MDYNSSLTQKISWVKKINKYTSNPEDHLILFILLGSIFYLKEKGFIQDIFEEVFEDFKKDRQQGGNKDRFL